MDTETVYFASADAPGPDATWGVYREQYAPPGSPDPIDGSEERVGTFAGWVEAEAEVNRLHERLHAGSL